MRIGTWNMEGKWSALHSQLLERQACDVWLLTEVPTAIGIPGMGSHLTSALMSPTKAWAGIVATAEIHPEPDPHPASAMARIGGTRWISSVLPWRTSRSPWPDATLSEKLRGTLAALADHLDASTVWGGDWNQALEGPEYAGTLDGRNQILALAHAARLSVPTRTLTHAKKGHRSIDHIAVPLAKDIDQATRVSATASGCRLSDHDAYIVDLADTD